MSYRMRSARAPLGTSLWTKPTTPPKTCNRCGGTIHWQLTKNKKYMPVDADGRPHPRDCAKRGRK